MISRDNGPSYDGPLNLLICVFAFTMAMAADLSERSALFGTSLQAYAGETVMKAIRRNFKLSQNDCEESSPLQLS